ncbi:MAG TPA: class I SAM-dependent methyltransferase [Candidatus Bathyarchaeia archaeon]|nr:class I SAM-dependent methyltransferase [Candidatus Bathyarchaeia archaeon]
MFEKWDDVAVTRRFQVEAGLDITFSRVFVPYYHDLVSSICPNSLLEVGCGTGHLAFALAPLVQTVVALEPSVGMYNVAKEVLCRSRVKLLNSSVEEYVINEEFDLIISHMCLQAVANLDAFLCAVAKLAGRKSTVVFSIPHPCFYNAYKCFFHPSKYQYYREVGSLVSFSISKDPITVISGIPYTHRPLSRYFSAFKSSGLHTVDFHEILPADHIQKLYGKPWTDPRYCVFFLAKSVSLQV